MGVRIRYRRGTSAQWAAANPILEIGEPGYDTNLKKTKIGDGITPWNNLPYQDKNIQALAFGDPAPIDSEGSNGDFYYQTSDSSITVHQKVNSVWVERGSFNLSGEPLFTEGFEVNLPDNKTGVPNGTIVEDGDAMTPFLKAAFRAASPAVYNQPVSNLTANQTTTGHEVGETIAIDFTLNFTQNDAGAETSELIKKGGVTLSPDADSDTIVLSTSEVSYQGFVSFADGPVKDNGFGDPDPDGQIEAGVKESNILNFRGYYKIFYGPIASPPTNSATVRALPTTRFTNDANAFTLNTGTTELNFALWLPTGKTLVSVINQDALNLDITDEYVGSSLSVNNAAGTPVTGTLYVKTQGVPYTVNQRHNITIS